MKGVRFLSLAKLDITHRIHQLLSGYFQEISDR